MRSTLKKLAIEIESIRHLLEAAERNEDFDLATRALRLSIHKHGEFYEATKAELGLEADDSLLVFCELFPDGAVMDVAWYRLYLMNTNHQDRECHQAIPVASEMADEVRSVLIKMLAGKVA